MTVRPQPSLVLYRLLLRAALPVAAPLLLLGGRARGKARPPVGQRLRPRLEGVQQGGWWVQAVSVGEVELARRLIHELEHQAPALPVLVTSTTTTGLALARRTIADRVPVHPCPLDLPGPLRRLLAAARPRLVVLVETELWPELLHQAALRKVPVALANARLSEQSFPRYRRVRPLLRPLLDPLSLVLARSQTDAERFAELGVPDEKIRVVGNIKYDLEPSREALPWAAQLGLWAAGRPVLVAGSTMDGEEQLLLDAVEAAGGPGRVFLVLAPRHPERFPAVRSLLDDRGARYACRSAVEGPDRAVDVLLLDTIGELGRAYGMATVAFVGGSLVDTGGHNPLEPAAWSVPVLTGPHVFNFREVYDELVGDGGALVVEDGAGLARALEGWIDDPSSARAAGAAALAVLERNRGATARTVSSLLELAG